MSMTDESLDISRSNPSQRRLMLRYATETRRFEIERFWQRSLFFWGFVGAAFVAYAALQKESQIGALIISCFGTVSSLAWTLQNRGSKYWQEAWEVERSVLDTNLFTNIEPLRPAQWGRRGPWRGERFSVSKLAIALSDFTVIVWCLLVAISYVPFWVCRPPLLPVCVLGGTVMYAIALMTWGRSSAARSS